ncbi:hypothetical protein M422DRAFT_276172 [Sphaerobolus stellatus SS14]|uniref:Uncharacterized protein n=1 Tax=Sphaerobolus stellatus (strain SS14) TaxID=990650 RepID=A0A0C9T353_SPHS4|nr:hypothetical protein M422DRAFT_276172 [Sphaerobolus stellatus SS14]
MLCRRCYGIRACNCEDLGNVDAARRGSIVRQLQPLELPDVANPHVALPRALPPAVLLQRALGRVIPLFGGATLAQMNSVVQRGVGEGPAEEEEPADEEPAPPIPDAAPAGALPNDPAAEEHPEPVPPPIVDDVHSEFDGGFDPDDNDYVAPVGDAAPAEEEPAAAEEEPEEEPAAEEEHAEGEHIPPPIIEDDAAPAEEEPAIKEKPAEASAIDNVQFEFGERVGPDGDDYAAPAPPAPINPLPNPATNDDAAQVHPIGVQQVCQHPPGLNGANLLPPSKKAACTDFRHARGNVEYLSLLMTQQSKEEWEARQRLDILHAQTIKARAAEKDAKVDWLGKRDDSNNTWDGLQVAVQQQRVTRSVALGVGVSLSNLKTAPAAKRRHRLLSPEPSPPRKRRRPPPTSS